MFRICILMLPVCFPATTLAESQQYTIHIPSRLSVHPLGSSEVTIPYRLGESTAVSTPQLWEIQANAPQGATVHLSAPPFGSVNLQPPVHCNVRLEIEFSEADPTWTLSESTSQSELENGEVARVTAGSLSPGDAHLLLHVTLEGVNTLPAGTYRTTVTGTITPN